MKCNRRTQKLDKASLIPTLGVEEVLKGAEKQGGEYVQLKTVTGEQSKNKL